MRLHLGSLFMVFASALYSSSALAAAATDISEPSLRIQPPTYSFVRDVTRSQISIGMESSMLTSITGSLLGLGPRVGFDYGLTDDWSLAANMRFAFDMSGTPGALLYTGLNGMVHYAVLGSSVLSTSRIRRADGTEIFTAHPSAKRRVTVMAGLEQLFLNGTTSIYPAVGYFAGGSWAFSMMGREVQVDCRYSGMTANNNPLTMIGCGVGLNLTL